jgi:hypothetical protein
VPRPVERELWLPGVTGRPELIEPADEPAGEDATVGRVELEMAG